MRAIQEEHEDSQEESLDEQEKMLIQLRDEDDIKQQRACCLMF